MRHLLTLSRPLNPYPARRVMLKVSGEALEGSMGFGIDPAVLRSIAKEVSAAASEGVEIAIVVGGGNFFRGVDRWDGLERASADYVGMLATVMNAICLQSALEAEGVATRVQTAIEMQEIAEPYIRRRAIRHLQKGRVVIFGAGTGNPFFTTDTAAALRAAEIGAGAFFKATKVDGVYDCDPVKNPAAKLHRHLSFRDVVLRDLHVMDETAITLCKENDIPVVVFNLATKGNILRAILGDPDVGTSINNVAEEEED
jgi:uridylate kinase